jgi:CRP/FNR family transcriptional regulator, anaerobic regulatory protein
VNDGAAQPPSPHPGSDDGDALHFCTSCAFSSACTSEGYDKSALRDLHVLVEHVGPYDTGKHIFRVGDPFGAIAAVRAGSVKTYLIDEQGREQVLGFYLPGEIIGLNALHSSAYTCSAVALEPVLLCRFSFPKIALLASRMPGLQQRLFALLSEDIGKATLLSGAFTADERMAALLVSLSRRYAARGLSPTRLRLSMTRTDIGNYLRLAPETVSRVLRRFATEGTVLAEGREVSVLNAATLEQLARSVLRC